MQPAISSEPADHRSLWFFNTLVHLRVSDADGNDSISVLEHRAPFGDSPPLHIHHDEDEVFHIIDGELRFQVGGHELRLWKGETVIAPRGIPHTYRVESSGGGRFLTVTGNRSFERFVRLMGRPVTGDMLPVCSPPPSAAQLDTVAKVARTCGIEFVGPPLS
jgi:quercetin dioxygenase-like cupin family protein